MLKKKIYLANQEGTNLYKIGVTRKDSVERLKELQTGNAAELKLIVDFTTKFGYKLESLLHSHYKDYNIKLEWFELTDEEVSLFIDVCEKYEKINEALKDNPFF